MTNTGAAHFGVVSEEDKRRRAEVKRIEDRGTKVAGEPLKLSVWSRAELQVTDERYEPLGAPRSPEEQQVTVPESPPR